jgi:hypothetical protein
MTPRTELLVAVALVALLTPQAVRAQTSSNQTPSAAVPDKPGVIFVERASTSAVVDAVDQSRRTVTLKRPDGQVVTLKAPPEIENFDQVRLGDRLRVDYLDAVALFVRQAGAPPETGETAAVGVAPKGDKPGAVTVNTTEVTAKVEAVDYGKRMLTLTGPGGNRRVVKVDDRVRRLNEVKAGDDVVVRHTESVVIAFQK